MNTPPLAAVQAFIDRSAPAQPAAPTPPADPLMSAGIPKEGIEITMPGEVTTPARAEPEPEVSTVQPNPVISEPSELPTTANLLSDSMKGVVVQPLTPEEKTLFQVALWHGSTVDWVIPMCGGSIEVLVRSLPSYRIEDALLAWAMAKLKTRQEGDGKNQVSLSAYFTDLQRAYTFMRVKSLTLHTPDGKSVENFDVEEVDKKILTASDNEQAIAVIDTWIESRVRGDSVKPMHHLKFSMMVEAMRVHEQKLCTCIRNASSPSFWLPGTPS